MRRALLFAAALALLAPLAACRARQPGSTERFLAVRAKRLVVGGKGDRNPLPVTPESIHAGQQSFSHYCYACHGLDGHWDAGE